ncbi:MAG: SO_0444 family Cu/Zn efflux transporter [Deltaproteobacteria bacterium]|nr:SO_0444 family Cu/Zn efflux transporter [Deltaproteobacteria bacterium]
MNIITGIFNETWQLFLEASPYILFGLLVSGLLRTFLDPSSVAHHLGHGRIGPVLKAAVLGIPIPLCSCGVLPAAASLKKQGANNGATTAFLIATPESGADSIAISYALLDPILTIARPVVAFVTAAVAGIAENLVGKKEGPQKAPPDISCPIDGCCDGKDCSPEVHRHHHTTSEKLKAGLKFAVNEVWGDLVLLFAVGLFLAGVITYAIPDDLIGRYMGGGLPSMLIMLAAGIPLYICATSSTPIAAALILKGVSPGAALVFLIAGPATNITSLAVLLGILGKRATVIYLTTIAVLAVLAGLAVDQIYAVLGISARAAVGQAAGMIPPAAKYLSALLLLAISVKPLTARIKRMFAKDGRHGHPHDHAHHAATAQKKEGDRVSAAEPPLCTGPT